MKRRRFLKVFLIAISLLLLVLVVRAVVRHAPIGEKVAIVDILGPISSAEPAIDQIHKYRDDPTVKAIILRINSPGGGVAPVQEIYGELEKLDKPIVASMASTAASGGYYIAAAADVIFANPGTLTGSIGVIMQFMQMQGLYEKIGLNQQVVKSGKFKDTGSAVRDLTDEERELLQKTVNDVHNQFIDAIFLGRKEHMTREEIASVADGRIFSGQQALAHKLVDRLGNLHDAIALAGELGGIEGEPRVVRTERKISLLERLLGTENASRLNQLIDVPGISLRYELSF